MNTYRVDFTREDLRRNRNAPTRLMRDMRRVAASLRKSLPTAPMYVRKRRTDHSLGYWFQFDTDLQKNAEAVELLKPYAYSPASAPVIPQSEWKPL